MTERPAHRLDFCVNGKYRLRKKIGSGSFGMCYCYLTIFALAHPPSVQATICLGVNIVSGKEVAIKLESVKAKHLSTRCWPAASAVPFVRCFGTKCDYNATALSLLSLSLEDLFNFCDRKFNPKTVLLLAD